MGGNKFIKPFRKSARKNFPNKKSRDEFSNNWSRLCGWFDDDLPTDVAVPCKDATDLELNHHHNRCKTLLSQRASHFHKDGSSLKNLTSTWANRITRASIDKHGTPSDKEKLGVAANCQKPRIRKFSRRGSIKKKQPQTTSRHHSSPWIC